ncbi:MAG: guanine-specific ribonuclease N1 and T1 [Comamonadaceae bacterium]|nr:MAG: guanine-specific ribonuclease N1 and T1 [Comamonadaceae bacterium]
MARIGSPKFVLTGFVLAVALAGPILVQAKGPRHDVPADGNATITVPQLPRQGQQILNLIRQGGPFAHDKDGSVFGNRERLLPSRQRGYYREYTVDTPGSRDRGARRIVCGGPPRIPEACYYTGNHYASFSRIVE